MNYFELHIGDYDSATAHLSVLEDGIYGRLLRVYYRIEAPLPAEIKQVCRLVRAASKPERDTVAEMLTEFFELRADGWHNVRCDEEVLRYQDKQRKARASAEARWGAHRPQSDGNADAYANASPEPMRTHSEGNAPRACSTLQTPDTKHQTQTPEKPGARPDATTLRALAEGTAEPENPAEGAGTRYGLAARAMRQRGCAAAPGDPRLRQLVDQGASLEEFEAVGAEAADKGKGPAWALTALINRRKDAEQVRLAPAAAPPPWHETRDGVSSRGQQLGIGAWQDFSNDSIRRGKTPSWDAYRRRVIDADADSTATAGAPR